MVKNNRIPIILILLFAAFIVFLTLNKHSKSGSFNYHSEIWGDKAGYYMYLPAFFIYDFQASKLPPGIEKNTGNGFVLNPVNNKIATKYTCGVALLQAPFFLLGHFAARPLGYEANGFSLIYQRMIDIAGVFYALMGLILLYLVLLKFTGRTPALLTLFCLFFGTNLFYYSIDETGMSHVYSFFLFAASLFLVQKLHRLPGSITTHILLGLTLGLIVLVRPVNLVFFPVLLLFYKPLTGYFTQSAEKPRLRIVFSFYKFTIGLAAFILVLLPQLIYWHYLSGEIFMYSYRGEGFTNLFHPMVFHFWFSTLNGLFIYTPVFFLVLAGMGIMYKENRNMGITFLVYFLFISLLFASWHDWAYGCAFGCRPFVEYLALFSIPLAFFMKQITKQSRLKWFILSLIGIFIIINIKLIYSYDGCWPGGLWDWKEYMHFLTSSTK